MYRRYICYLLLYLIPTVALAKPFALRSDSVALEPHTFDETLQTVEVRANSKRLQTMRIGQTIEWLDSTYLTQHFTGNFAATLSTLPGVNVITIGSGYGKPVIRGLGFNRIAYVDGGLKQEGQQWGADHGLEVDAFDQDPVQVIKGAGSLLYGSDALGGVIVRQPAATPHKQGLYGSYTMMGQSSTMGGGGSLMMGYLHGAHHIRLRMSGQYHGDRNVTADSITYLTRWIPIYNRRLKNSATQTYASQLRYEWLGEEVKASLQASVNGERSGFFPGAHGMPDLKRVLPDKSRYNIELPYSTVRQISTQGSLQWRVSPQWQLVGELGWQQNLRRELSAFHTHYGTMQRPVQDADLEFEFDLKTVSARLQANYYAPWGGKWTLATDGQYQWHKRRGYGFLLPDYQRATSGVSLTYQGRIAQGLHLTSGLRYDLGYIAMSPYHDPYLADYLKERGESSATLAQYYYSSQEGERRWHDLSGSVGLSWQINRHWLWKVNLGRSFRLPGIYELAANGIHHGTFRHEVGDPSLGSEQGWLLDSEVGFHNDLWSCTVSPFVTYFTNYIFLQPSGEWSILPHSGQIYRYQSTRALFTGVELEGSWHLHPQWDYHLQGDYVYTYNVADRLALPYSPPARLSHDLTWHPKHWALSLKHRIIAPQHRIARNEAPTPGTATLLDLAVTYDGQLRQSNYRISLAIQNILNSRYYDHMSYYRRVNLPEAGRNLLLTINLSF